MWLNQYKTVSLLLIVMFLTTGTIAQQDTDFRLPILEINQTPVKLHFISANSEGIDFHVDELSGEQVYLLHEGDAYSQALASGESDTPPSFLYENIYDNIDLIVNRSHLATGKINVKFVIFPGANPNQIQFDMKGFKTLELLEDQLIQSESNSGWFFLDAPVAYQDNGREQFITVESQISRNDYEISFNLKKYDPLSTVTIEVNIEWIPEINGTLPTAFHPERHNTQVQ